MNNANLKKYAFWILVTEAVGALSGFLSREGMEIYAQTIRQPPFSPPGWIFPVVWTVLYALMGIGIARIRSASPGRDSRRGTNLFIAQLIVNFFWSLIFFNARALGFAFFWLLALWLLVLLMILRWYRVDKTSAWLQLPYLLWLTFAAYLNFSVWQLNR